MFESWYKELTTELAKVENIDDISEHFRGLLTDSERISYVSSIILVISFINKHSPSGYQRKNTDLATKYRNEGNTFFNKKHFSEARKFYTKAILYSQADVNDPKLSLAYANRSASLYHEKHYKECLMDIDMALNSGYPAKLKYKILERKAKCLKLSSKTEESNACLKLALKALNEIEITVEGKNTAARNILSLQVLKLPVPSDVQINGNNNQDGCGQIKPKIKESKKSNKYPCATSSFGIQMSENSGRTALALDNISAGEIILAEKPFASLLLPNGYQNNCYACLCPTVAPMPCRQCAYISFCSVECEATAWEEYHQFECKVLQFIDEENVQLAQLALRMVLKTNLSEMNELLSKENQNYDLDSGVNDDGKYLSQNYSTAFYLEGHSMDRPLPDLFKRTILALFLTHTILSSTYSEFNDITDIDSTYRLFAIHILRNSQMLPCNAHEISKHNLNISNIAISYNEGIGSGIYPVLSLLNHSCDPNVVRHCYGDMCVLRAIKHIPKGTEIIDNYGSLYAVTERSERHTLLQNQYYFTCKCQACISDWPLYVNLKELDPIFKCQVCEHFIQYEHSNLPCKSCNKYSVNKFAFLKLQESYKDALNDVLTNGKLNLLPDLELYIDFLSQNIVLPWQEFNSCQEIIKQCYSMMANCIKES